MKRKAPRFILSAAFALFLPTAVKAAVIIWDPANDAGVTGGSGAWDDLSTSNWFNGADVTWNNANNDIAQFGGTTAGTVTLGSAITAGGLLFNTSGYEVTGNTLTLAVPTGVNSPIIRVGNALGHRAVISSILAGSSGFTKTGNGTLVLTGANTGLSGDVSIKAGSVVITNQNQLGSGTTAISITGSANTGNPGYSGGSLVLAGTTGSGAFTLSREVSVSGRGPGAANVSGGLISVGYNTISGGLTIGSGAAEGRVTASHGITTVSNGGLNLGTGGASIFQGNGNWIVSGQVTGSEASQDRLIKGGNVVPTTLWLQNANNNFAGAVRIDAGTVRVSTNSALGGFAGTQAMDLNGGRLEIRSDAPDFTTRNLNIRGNTNQIFVDRAIGGSGLNQNFVFGNLNNSAANGALVAEGRNGANLSVTGPLNNAVPGINVISWINGGTLGLTNSGNGLFTINASINRLNETTARVLTITATGETVVTGNILQTGTGAVSLTKAGAGTFTIQGTASTATGTTTISDGTLSIGSFASIPSGAILIGNATTTPGALTYTGGPTTASNPLTLNSTTAAVYINASGTGALNLTGPISQIAATGAKTIFLGGTAVFDNTIAGVLSNNGTAVQSLQKIGPGNWVLAGGASNTFTGITTISNGTLKLQEAAGNFDILPDAGAVTFNVDTFTQASGATLNYVGAAGVASTELVGALTATTGGNTVSVTPGAAGTAVLTFASLAVPAVGTGLNFSTGAGGVVLTGATNTNGILSPKAYFNGADFAAGSTVGAATYTDSAVSLIAANTNPYRITGSFTQSTATVNAGIKFDTAQTLTIGNTQTLTLTNGGTTGGGILVTGGIAVTIANQGTATGITTGSGGDIVVRTNAGSDSLAINAPIINSGTNAISLTKLGAGTLTLGGTNTITGTATVNEGTLKLTAGGTLGGANVGLVVRQGATFDLNGQNVGTVGAGGANALNGAGTITNTAAATTSVLRIGNGNTAGYFSGVIQDGAGLGRIALSKAGSGTVSLSGSNTFSGGVTIGGGTLAVTSLSNIGSASGIGTGIATDATTNAASLVFNNGTLTYTGATATIYQTAQTPSVSVDRLFTLAGNGTISSEGSYGANRLTTRAANHAALIFNNTAPVVFSGAGVRTLTLQGDSIGDNQLNLRLINNGTDALSFTKAGTGMWILGNATNSYTGLTTISGGALRAQDGTSLPNGITTGSNLLLSGGVLESTGTFSRGLGTDGSQFRFAATGNGGFSSGNSKLTVDWSGLGTPVWGSTSNFLGAGALILNSTTSLADVEVTGNFDLLAGAAATPTISTTNASATITITTGSTSGLTIGQAITGTNIPAGSYINSITGTTTFTINQNATATGTLIAATVSAGGWREVQVNDNTSTNLDFATVSGVLGGTSGLGKNGAGSLILGNANTYTGRSVIRQDAVFATSLGASGATATSFGTNVGGGAIELGNPGAGTTVSLMYVGPGETTTREIDLGGTTGTRRIDSSGSGPLILTNLLNSTAGSVNTTGGNKTLEIRGSNMDGNMITSVLADNAGALRLLKTDGGYWILNNAANTFTGGTRVDGGTLGIADNGSLGVAGATGRTGTTVGSNTTVTVAGGTAGLVVGQNISGTGISYGDTIATIVDANTITISAARTIPAGSQLVFGGLLVSNSAILATNPAGLTLTQPIVLNTNTSIVFDGSNPITLNGDIIKNTGANDVPAFSNNLQGGAVLTVNGNFLNFNNTTATTRLFNIRGLGSTVWNGDIKDNALDATARTGLTIQLESTASFTLAGGSPNTFTGGTSLQDGILILDKVGALGGAAGTFTFNGGTLRVGATPTNLSGANAITNPVVIAGTPPKVDGAKSIEFSGAVTMAASRNLQNELTGGAQLIFSNTIAASTTTASTLTLFGTGNTLISGNVNAGTGVQSLQLSGTGALSLTGTNLATGALTATRSTITLSGTTGGSWNAGTAAVNPGGTLTLDNSGGNNAAGRLFDTGAFTGNGGTLNIISDGAASTETTGALALNNVQTKITMSGAGTNTLTFASVTTPNTGSSLDLSSITSLGTNNKVIIGGTLPTNFTINSILPRTFINSGADFATYDVTNGVKAFTAYNVGNNLNTAAATDTLDLTASANTTGNRTVNALKINGTGLTIGGAGMNRLTLNAAAILNTTGSNTLSTPEVAFAANFPFIQTASGTTLTVNSAFTGSGGFSKALPGTLAFGAGVRSFITSTHNLLDGTTTLSGGADTLFPNQALTLNLGATLNLNGGGQYSGTISSAGALPGTGGTITGGGAFVTNGGGTFGGEITSALSLGRVGGGTLVFERAQTYTGTTLLMGGTTTLENDATILSTTGGISLNNATLFLSNNSSLQTQNNNRIADSIPLNLRGGTITVTGRIATAATETFGVLNALEGSNTITINATGGAANTANTAGAPGSTDVTFAQLTRGAGTTLNFTGTTLGQQGNSGRIVFTTPLTTVLGGALGAWAIANTTDYAAYNTSMGVGIVGTGGYAGYDSSFASGNITEIPAAQNATTTTLLPGNTTTGLLKFAVGSFNNLTFTAGGDILNLEQGGLLRSNQAFGTSIGTTAVRGVLTAGGTEVSGNRELHIFNNGSGATTFGAVAVTTIGSPVVTGLSTVGLQPGMTVTNANFPAGTKVVSIQNSGQATLSNNATATATAQTFTAGAIDLGTTTINTPTVTMSSTVGIQPGMTLTGTGIPANSFVVSVNSATEVTISQNATATGSALTLTAGLSNVVINSVITNNGLGNNVTLVKSGAGVLALSAANTYTGGTIVNSPLNLISPGTAGVASNVVIPAGGITINNGTVTMLTNQGQINSTNAVTLRGGSVMTLVGANTLASLAFDNNGGTATPTVTTGGILTLTGATPITVSSSNPATIPTIAGSINIGTGAKTIDTPAIQVGGTTVTKIVPTLAITANILSPGVTLTKTGNGLLQLSGQSTFTGGVLHNAGGLVIGTSSTPAQGGTGLTSGPLGTGALTVASTATLFSNSTAAIGNNISFGGTPTFDATANTVWTLTLNGALSGAGMTTPVQTVHVANPGLTVALLGSIPNIASITSFNKTGVGALIFNSTGYTGNYDASALGNPNSVSLLHDGTGVNIGNGVVETISLGSVTFDAGIVPAITVGRAGGSLPFNLASNKILSPSSISNLGLGITVTNSNGYGLEALGAIALTGTPTISVSAASASNLTQGLSLPGAVSGTGFNKIGAGVVVLGSGSNGFTGTINIQNGGVSVSGNAQLGGAGNIISLNPGTATTGLTSFFRATGSFTLANPLQLGNATANTRTIEVTGSNTLTLSSAFDLNAGGGTAAALTKADAGTLAISANNNTAGWTGVLTIGQGEVNVLNAGALGTTAGNTIVNASGAALLLPQATTLAEPLQLAGTGIFTAGALRGTGTGTSVQSGLISLSGAAAIGADNLNILSVTGGLGSTSTTAQALTLVGQGAISISGTAISTGIASITKIGTGATTLGVASAAYVGTITVNRGSLTLGSAGVGSLGGTGLILVNQNGSFTVDNTTSPASRWTNRPVTLAGGTLNYNTTSASPFTDTSTGALTLNSGANSIVMTNGGASTTSLVFGSLTFGAGGTGNVTGLSTSSNLLKFGTTTPALTPATTGILAKLIVGGNEFATYNGLLAAGNGVVAFTGYAAATNILSAGATQTFKATNITGNSLTGNQTINALTLSGTTGTANVGGLAGLNPTTLTLTSGAVLVNSTGAVTTLSVPVVQFGATGTTEAVVHVASGATLDVTSGFNTTGGLTKALNGTLNLNRQQYVSGTTTVNGGILNLQAGATNTLLFNNSLTVNTGATLDLKNGTQFVNALNSQAAAANTDLGGGTITSTGGPATFVVSSGGFGGTITNTGGNAIYLNKTTTGGLTFTNAQSYTGDTLITGGTITLVDSGTINTPNIGINYGSLTLTNTGLLDNGDRVNNAPITMKGGNISFNGRAQSASTETLGAVTLVEGYNTIFNTAGGTGINSSVLTLDSITRSVGSTATLRINNNGVLGTIGSVASLRISGVAPTLSNNIIGPWATSDREFVSYDATYGLGGLNTTGFAGYAGSGLNSSPLATDNVRQTFAGGTTTLIANTVVNTLNISQTATSILDLGGNTLRMQGGGMIIAVNTDASTMTLQNGTITSGTVGSPSDFYLHVTPFSNNTRNTVIGAAIADNAPITGPVRLIVTIPDNNAASTLTLSGINTYTGGTVINQGPVILGAAGVLGTGGVTVNGPGSLTQLLGGSIPSSNSLTLGGSSTVTLANQANSLAGITVSNMGGSAPTLTPTGTLTLTGGITVTTMNAGAVATIGAGNLDLNGGAGSYAINVGAALVNGVDVAPWQPTLNISSVVQNAPTGGITKSGAGVLQLSGQSTFAGGLAVTAGGLAIGANSTPNLLLDPVTTGPLGTGAVTMSANTTLVAAVAAAQVSNNFIFLGNTVFNGTNSLTLNGITTLPATWNATVTAPQMVVTIGDASPSGPTDQINKFGLGILTVGNYAGTINAAGGLLFSADGNGLGTLESLSLGSGVTLLADTAITVNRSGSGSGPNARNKTLQKTTLDIPGSIMSVSNQSGYGLEFTGATTVTGAAHFTVGVATASNVVQGLILSGTVDDGASNFGLIKSGPGTLVLNGANTFGSGNVIQILNGVVSINSDASLGNAANTVTMDVDGSTNVGLRATGTFATSRSILLNQVNNAIEVTAGNEFTLNTAFGLGAVSNTLTKNDNGVLVVAASNGTWTGAITINAGAIRAGAANALGTGAGTITINSAIGSALQIGGGFTVSNPITIVTNAASGIQSQGVIEATSGVNNIVSNVVTQTATSATYGAAAGATLNINGGISTTTGTATFFAGAGGVVNLNSVYGPATTALAFNKTGPGALNITVNQAGLLSDINFNAGTVNISGNGVTLGSGTGTIQVNGGATLNIDDNVGAASGHFGNRPLNLRAATFSYAGNATGSAETTTGALTINRGSSSFTTNANGAATSALTFASLAFSADSSVNFEGTNLGTASNRILFTTAPTLVPATTGILARATVGNNTFATYDAALGIKAFTAYSAATNINSAAATDTVDVVTLLTSNLTATKTLNALRFTTGTPQTVGGAAFNQLVLTAGGVLATGGVTHSLSVPVLANAAVQNVFTVGAGTTLNVTSAVTGSGGLVKSGAGILTLTPNNFGGVSANTLSGNVSVNDGILRLAGGTNTLLPNQFLIIGGPTATLDLNGTSQQVLGLITDAAVDGSGGIITSLSGTGSLVVNQDANDRNFAGSIQGTVNFTRSGPNTLTLYTDQTYTGTTLLEGGTTTLRNGAKLSGTGTLDINYATLLAENGGTTNDNDRINDSKAITLRGATLTIQGRAQTATSETLGTVSVAQGLSTINPLVGGTGVNSVDVSLASLSRPGGSSATLTVGGTALGTIGSASRLTVTTLNGVATTPVVYSANGSGLTNNIVGGWAKNVDDFLTYIPGLGLAPLNQTGAPGYDMTNTLVGASSTDNVRLTATTSVPNGGATVNALSMSGSNIALTFATGGDTLNITSGGLIGPNNNQTIGATVDSGRLTAGGPGATGTKDLYVFNRANTLTINSRIVDNGAALVRSVFTATGGVINLVNPANSYSGGTVLNGGTLNLTNTAATAVIPAGGLEINGGTVTMNNFAGQINSANVVTLRSGILNYFGDNTQEGLVMNNIGGTGNQTVQTFSTVSANGAGSAGVLTIGNSGIVATSSNVGIATTVGTNTGMTTNTIAGRVDFGATSKTVSVAQINANGVDINPLQPGMVLTGIVGSTGGFTKTGNGVLLLGAQSHYTGPTDVNAGSLRISFTNSGSRFSKVNLNGATTAINLAGFSTALGSLEGSGLVFNSGAAQTLTVGVNGDNTTFSGQLARFNDAVINGVALQKAGTGTMSMTSAQSSGTGTTGTITVSGGTLKYVDAGAAFVGTAATGATTIAVNNGGILALDNTGTANVNSRLGLAAIGSLNIQGGTLTINGTATALTPTTETVTTFGVVNGGGRVDLTANPSNPLTLAIGTLNTANGTGTLVVGGINGVASANGVANLTITTPNFLGAQGAGANASTTMSIRHDILADATVGGIGTGFLVRDSVTNNFRALASGELNSVITTWAGTQNAGLSSAQTLAANIAANSLTISGTSSIASSLNAGAFGAYGPGGSLLTLNLSNASAILALSGSTSTISVGSLASTTAGTTPFIHVQTGATLNVGSALGIAGTAGLNKADGGTLNLTGRAYYTGATTVNGGTLNLNSGQDNTLAVSAAAGAATASALSINGTSATVNLQGKSQAVGTLTSINPLPGMGGTITNGGTAATLTSNGGGVFAGQITGAIAFTRAGNNTTTLTSANTYTGATIVRGGTLQLRDSGSISSTAGLILNYGTLNWDNIGINPLGTPNLTRVAANNPVTLQGGTFQINGAGSTDNIATLNTVTVTGGANNINTLPFSNGGSTVKLTIGNLVRNAANHSGVSFVGFNTNNIANFNVNGSGSLGNQGLSTNSNILISQINGATGPLNQITAGAVTTAGSNIVTVPFTTGLVVGQPVTGSAGIPAGEFITGITSPTTFTITTGTGVTAQTGVTITSTNLTDQLIGGWAVHDGSTFASYSNIFGVVGMGTSSGGYTSPAFSGADISAATTAASNIAETTDRTIATGAKAVNSLRFSSGSTTARTITMASGATLSIDVGFISNQNATHTYAATDATNTITGTGADLYFFINQATTIVQPSIIGTAALVNNGPATLRLAPTFASNTYSGGTFAQGGTLSLQAISPFVAVPGDLTITNATVSMATTAGQTVGQIAPTSNVFINGGGVLQFPSYTTGPTQTLASVTFNNEGGSANPNVSLGTPTTLPSTVILSSATPLTSTNNSLGTTPTFSGAGTSALQFSNANPVITVNSGLAMTGLTISAVITQHGSMTTLTKSGTGSLDLSGQNTFTTGFNLSQGTLLFGANSTPATPGVITSGPVGTGTLTIGNGTTVQSDGATRTIANAVTVGGDFTIGALINGTGVIFAGAVDLGATGRTITVASPAALATFSAPLTSTATGTALTKAGPGTLTLSAAGHNFGGAGVAITGGLLKIGANDTLPVATPLSVSAGAGFDMTFNQTLDSLSGAGFVTNSANATRTLTISGAANSNFSGIITDNRIAQTSSQLNLIKTGSNTQTLSGNNSYFGTTTVTGGVLRVGASGVIPDGSALIINTSGTFDLNGNTETVLSLAGDATGIVTNALGSGTGTLIVNGTTTTTFAGTLTNTAGGVLALTKNGTGTLNLTGTTNNYDGLTTVSGGVLTINNATSLGTATAGTTVNGGTLRISNNITVVGEALTLAGAGVTGALDNLSGTNTWNGTVALSNDATITTTAGSLTISGALSDGGTAKVLTKNGAGTLVLSADSSANFRSLVSITAGTLSVSAGNNLGNGSATNDLSIAGATLESTGAVSLTALQGVAIGAGGATLKVTSGNSLTILGDITGTTGLTKTDLGTATLSGDNSGFSGPVAVNGGVLSVGLTQNLGDESVTNNLSINGGTLEVTQTTDLTANRTIAIGASGAGIAVTGSAEATFSGVITGTAGITKTGNGTAILDANNATFSGPIAINAGTIAINDSSDLGSAGASNTLSLDGGTLKSSGASVDLTATRTVALGAGGGTFAVTGSNSLTVSGAISGSTNLTKSDTGTLALSANNSGYTGQMIIADGTLSVGADNNIGTGGVNFNGTANVKLAVTNSFSSAHGLTFTTSGTIDVATATTLTYTATSGLSGAGGLTKAGPGTLLVNGNNSTYTGPVTVAAGTFGGTGSVGGDVSVDGGAIIAPGASIGTLGAKSLTLANSATLSIEVNIGAPGETLSANGTADLIQLSLATGTALSIGTGTTLGFATEGTLGSLTPGQSHWTIATYNSGTGATWNGGLLNVPGFGNMTDYDNGAGPGSATNFELTTGVFVSVDYDYPVGGGLSGVALVVVPEPGSMASLAGAAGMLLGLQRFRRRTTKKA